MRAAILIAFNFGIFIVANGSGIGQVLALQSQNFEMECEKAWQRLKKQCKAFGEGPAAKCEYHSLAIRLNNASQKQTRS